MYNTFFYLNQNHEGKAFVDGFCKAKMATTHLSSLKNVAKAKQAERIFERIRDLGGIAGMLGNIYKQCKSLGNAFLKMYVQNIHIPKQ